MKKISNLVMVLAVTVAMSPLFVSAQNEATAKSGFSSISKIIDSLVETVLKSAAGLLLTLAILAFFYGLVEYIWARRDGDATKLQKGNTFMTWSLVALFVMFSVYGIIKFAQNILFQGTDINTITIPDLKFKTSGGSTNNSTILGGNTNNSTNNSTILGGNTSNSTNNSSVTGGGSGSVGGYATAKDFCNNNGGTWNDAKGTCDSVTSQDCSGPTDCNTYPGGQCISFKCVYTTND